MVSVRFLKTVSLPAYAQRRLLEFVAVAVDGVLVVSVPCCGQAANILSVTFIVSHADSILCWVC